VRRKAAPGKTGDEPLPAPLSLLYSGGPPVVPTSPPGPPDPYRNLGYRIGLYARRIFESDLEALRARVQGRAGRDEKALAEGIAFGSGCSPQILGDGDLEINEIRCIFMAGAKRMIITPSPLHIPPETLRNSQVYEDFAGWLLAREDEDLFEAKFG